MASITSSKCAGLHLPGAPRPGRPLCARRPSSARFVILARASAAGGERQEPETSMKASEGLPQTEQSEDSRASTAGGTHEKHDEQQQDLGSQIEARGIACARELLLVQSVDQGDTTGVFKAVDADGNTRVDLRELSTALAKWTLLVTRPESPLAAAKNLALDLYLIFGVDPLEGFDAEQFRLVLQAWCLFTKISFEVMACWLETALDLPDVQLSPEDKMAAEEIAEAMCSPEAMAAAVDAHKIDLVFHLWDTDGDGVASRKRLTRALTWYYRLLDTVQQETGVALASGQRPEVIEFLEHEQRPGLRELDKSEFRALVQHFCQLTGLPLPEVCDFLMSVALSGGNASLEAMMSQSESAPDAPPQPGDIQGIMDDLTLGSQPKHDQAQQGQSTEHSDTKGGGGNGDESKGETEKAGTGA